MKYLQLTIAYNLCISLAILQQLFCKSILPFHRRQRNSSQCTRLQQQLSITATNNKNTQQQEFKHRHFYCTHSSHPRSGLRVLSLENNPLASVNILSRDTAMSVHFNAMFCYFFLAMFTCRIPHVISHSPAIL